MVLLQLKGVRLPAMVSLALALGACSSSPDSSPAAAPTPEAGTVADSLTVPCNIDTGYPGDDLCILPPDPKEGFQFHFGPKNYADPNEVAKYLLQPGEEKTECVFLESQNTETAYIQEYHSRLRPGSHHLLNYVQPTSGTPMVSDGPVPCNQNQNFRMLFGATSAKMDVTRAAPGLENEGYALQLAPKQQVALQLHVINATSKPTLREAWANFRYTDKSTVTALVDPIEFMGGVLSTIPVGQTVINGGIATVPAGAGPDFHLMAAIPHYHAHTTKFVAYKIQNGVKTPLLETFSTLGQPYEPTLYQFSSETQNPVPNEATQTPGAFSGIVHLAPGDAIQWECTQTNDGIGANGQTFTTPLAFTEEVYTGEMCNLFGLYGPTTGDQWFALGTQHDVVSTTN